MENMFFDSWNSIIRTLVISALAYILIIFLLRSSGKRTLSKMNAFDFIVTIALGSTLATVMLNKNVALIDGVLAFFLLIYFQFIITWLSARNKWVSSVLKSTPALLVYKGEMLKDMMVRERIDEDEIYAIVRQKGFSSLADVDAVVLETDGSLSVIQQVNSLQEKVMESTITPDRLK